MQSHKELLEDLKTGIPNTALNTPLGAPKKETDINNVFIPNPNNRPKKRKPIITINGESILTYQNVTTIIAPPGSGKSSLCEAICSSAINRECDTLGVKVSKEVSKVLFIDTERTEVDVWNSYDRMNKRAAATDSKKAQIMGLRMVPRIKERMETIENLIIEFKPDLLILDGSGDMVEDTNNLEQAVNCRILLRYLTVKYNLSILTTLHPNKGSKTARGAIGSELLRESEGVFIIETQGDVKTLTNDFGDGKNRNGGKVETSFTWCTEKNMFVSTERPVNPTKKHPANEALSNEQIIQLVKDLTATEQSATEFKSHLKIKLIEISTNILVGATAINDFYTWLSHHKYISLFGTGAKKVIKQHEDLDKPANEK